MENNVVFYHYALLKSGNEAGTIELFNKKIAFTFIPTLQLHRHTRPSRNRIAYKRSVLMIGGYATVIFYVLANKWVK